MMADRFEAQRIEPGSANYPANVSLALGRKAPALHVVGNVALLNLPGIGFCGARNSSEKGLKTTEDCAEQAVKAGFSVISGNARGVDFVAHHTALASGGSTILVLPEGTDHFRIRRELKSVWDWERVLVVSQFEQNAVWKAFRAMTRNQMIIALSQAMIVVEAGPTGGTLDAGVSTLSLGKPLFVAVYEDMAETAPGNAFLLARGGMRLTKSRATGRANLETVRRAAEHARTSGVVQHALI